MDQTFQSKIVATVAYLFWISVSKYLWMIAKTAKF